MELTGVDTTKLEAMLANAMDRVSKSTISTATGINMYDLQPLLKVIIPVLSPFRNKYLPRRISPIGGTLTNAKLLTGYGGAQGGVGIQEGKRGGLVTVNELDIAVMYRSIGEDASITFEAEESATGFDDAMATRTNALLNQNLITEEKIDLFGNGGNVLSGGSSRVTALGTPSAPTLAASAVPGTLPAATYLLYACALTSEGLAMASVVTGVATQVTRTNLGDASTTVINGGSSNISAASNSLTLGSAGSVAGAITAVPGALGYAWYLGTSKATAALAAVTNYNQVVISAAPAGTQTANLITADNSVNNLVYDGIITQMLNPNSGAYFRSLDGANLTGNGAAGVVEIDTALGYMWDNYRLGANHIMCGSDMKIALNKKIIGGGGAPLFRFNASANGNQEVGGNYEVNSYLNPYTNEMITIEIHPYFPKGFIWGWSDSLPYTTANVPMPFRYQARTRDWYQIDWPITTRERFIGQYVSALIIAYAPFAGFVLQNCGSL
jgi:hypothetical protein